MGARRIPTQLIESAAGLAIGLIALPTVVAGFLPVPGMAFILALAMYTAVRQILLRLRVEQRRSARTVPMTAVAAAGTLLVVGLLAVTQSGL